MSYSLCVLIFTSSKFWIRLLLFPVSWRAPIWRFPMTTNEHSREWVQCVLLLCLFSRNDDAGTDDSLTQCRDRVVVAEAVTVYPRIIDARSICDKFTNAVSDIRLASPHLSSSLVSTSLSWYSSLNTSIFLHADLFIAFTADELMSWMSGNATWCVSGGADSKFLVGTWRSAVILSRSQQFHFRVSRAAWHTKNILGVSRALQYSQKAMWDAHLFENSKIMFFTKSTFSQIWPRRSVGRAWQWLDQVSAVQWAMRGRNVRIRGPSGRPKMDPQDTFFKSRLRAKHWCWNKAECIFGCHLVPGMRLGEWKFRRTRSISVRNYFRFGFWGRLVSAWIYDCSLFEKIANNSQRNIRI